MDTLTGSAQLVAPGASNLNIVESSQNICSGLKWGARLGARIVLLAADGMASLAIGRTVGRMDHRHRIEVARVLW